MSLLDFARGPALQASLILLIAGTALRLTALLLLRWRHNRSRPRGSRLGGGLWTVFSRFWPMPSFRRAVSTGWILGYVSHLGLAIVVFAGVFHIEFIEGLLGVSWPGLPPPVITAAAIAALIAFLGLLIRRLRDPVVRFLSGWDDYFSWAVTVLPLATGLFVWVVPGLGYETQLAVHILSAELLLLWLPFGKLFHAVTFLPARAMTGATYGQRGLRV
jgi:nitrate reductase gamma subunit